MAWFEQPEIADERQFWESDRRGPVIHELKTWKPWFSDVMSGEKTFEVRRADRDFRIGDWLKLFEYDPENDRYTGNIGAVEITYILTGGAFGIDGQYCVLGIKLIEAIPK